ncbi:hypothetical protein NQ318_004925 [Aromia moschata]|uniref:Uncharacterized protein n=1 Tax=Aromia moschata TaxID=1265417 RepID=A0AAV8Z305_9CUCU|nr:hypothetical protein NQ318_004925 [Aromia moschata]
MYAAAGGASLASRQARQKQRQNKQKQQKQNKATELSRQPQTKQFQNYTDPAVPRLSRVERGALKPPAQHERRHSTSNYHLKEPQQRARIRESPSISIPVVQTNQAGQPLTPGTLVQHNHLPLHSTPSLQSQLPQILIPEGEGKLERRCSFVRQVEEMEKCQEQGLLDRCNHICNFEIKEKQWEANAGFYTDYDKDTFGSQDYPFSEVNVVHGVGH